MFAAKQRGSADVTTDHILLGCLRAISQFGIVSLGPWSLDLESLGVDWVRTPDGPNPKVAYSQDAVALFDRAALIAKSAGETVVGVNHLLAAFATEDGGLMGELKRAHGITSASWRAAIARLAGEESNGGKGAPPEKKSVREYLTPEEGADVRHPRADHARLRTQRKGAGIPARG